MIRVRLPRIIATEFLRFLHHRKDDTTITDELMCRNSLAFCVWNAINISRGMIANTMTDDALSKISVISYLAAPVSVTSANSPQSAHLAVPSP